MQEITTQGRDRIQSSHEDKLQAANAIRKAYCYAC
jgi:hypothetical protein